MKKKALSILLAAVLCLALLPIQASAAETLRMVGTDCIFTFNMWDVGDTIRLSNVAEITTTDRFNGEYWPYPVDCAVVYGQTTLTLLKSGILYASPWNGSRYGANLGDVTGKSINGSNAVSEPSEKNIGATLTLSEPGFYYVPYSVGGDSMFFSVEIRPALPKTTSANAAYAAYLRQIVAEYGILAQFTGGNVPNDLAVSGRAHPTGLFYGALVDFDENGEHELVTLYYEGAADDYFGVTCEVWSAPGGALKKLYSNKDNYGMPFGMAGNGPEGSISLTQMDGKPYLYTRQIGYTGSTKVEVDTLFSLTGGAWKSVHELVWSIQYPDEGGETHYYSKDGAETTAAVYQSACAKLSEAEAMLASTLSDGWSLRVGVPDYHTAVETFLASLDSMKTAKPTASAVLVDGKRVEFEAFEIDGNNYFKLRDIAAVLSGTPKQFNVKWDGTQNIISLISGASYTAVGGELTKGGAAGGGVTPGDASLLLDGAPLKLTVYTISSNNYFKLRDLGQVLNFSVLWDNKTGTIVIDTTSAYTPEV